MLRQAGGGDRSRFCKNGGGFLFRYGKSSTSVKGVGGSGTVDG